MAHVNLAQPFVIPSFFNTTIMASSESFQLDDCSFSFSTKGDCEHPRIFRNINLEVNHPKLGHVGSLYAVKIMRHLCGNDFFQIMDDHSDELQRFSLAFFDKFGQVKPWLYQPGNRRGTGAWGKEINNSTIVYVLNMFVDNEVAILTFQLSVCGTEPQKLRGKGLGSKMMEILLASKYIETGIDTLMCWPEPFGSMGEDEYEELKKKQIKFFKKAGNGFRRIGRTDFFGYSTDPGHPSRTIPFEQDATGMGDNSEINGSKIKDLSREDIAKKYPLHFAIMNSKGQEAIDAIQSHYKTNPASIHEPDAYGYTPIHLALCATNPAAVRALLELDVQEDMNNTNNIDGRTPFESLTDAMESSRTFLETMLGNWKGYEDDELECEFLMKCAMEESPMPDTLSEYKAKRKFGCTCGVCAGGWLSKRMRFRLCCGAEYANDMMFYSLVMGVFKNRVLCSDPWRLLDPVSAYLPPDLYSSMYKTFYIGWQSIFAAIAKFLNNTNQPLSAAAIVAQSAPERGVDFFFKKGGRVEYAFDALTDGAMHESPLGDGCFEEIWRDDDAWIKMPVCENDLEFDLVRQMLGLTCHVCCGPYESPFGSDEGEDYSDSEESEMSVDDEDRDGDGGRSRKTDETLHLNLPPPDSEEYRRLVEAVELLPRTNFGLDHLD